MIPTFLALIGFFATLGISERFATPRTSATVEALADTLEAETSDLDTLHNLEISGMIPGDYGYHKGDPYYTERFERSISDSGRAADSARGDLCPRVCPTAATPKPLPLVQLVQLATRSAVAPTSCASYACRLDY